jgi:hypothetical protein
MEHNDKMQSNRGDQDRPNRDSNMEQAEGSSETANSDVAGNRGGRGTSTMNRGTSTMNRGSELTEEAVGQSDDQGGGISNRPLEEEEGRQEQLPSRGERRDNRKED